MKLFRALRIIILFIFQSLTIRAKDISLVEFQGLLYTEVNSEIDEQQSFSSDRNDYSRKSDDDKRLQGRFLKEEDVTRPAEALWQSVVQHGWDMSRSPIQGISSLRSDQKKRRLERNSHQEEGEAKLVSEADPHLFHPFLVCSETLFESSSTSTSADATITKSGYARIKPVLNLTNAMQEDYIIVRNDPHKTCYHISMKNEDALRLKQSIQSEKDSEEDQISIAPLTDLMKIQVDTLSMIYEDSWTVPKEKVPSSSDDWERQVRVGFSAGHRMNIDSEEAYTVAKYIIEDAKSFGSSERRNRRTTTRSLRGRSNKGEEDVNEESLEALPTLSDTFSLTAMMSNNHQGHAKNTNERRLSNHDGSASTRWRRALREGLESDHSCEAMFESLQVNVHHNNQGFDIVLNPSSNSIDQNHNDGIEKQNLNDCEQDHRCTASNTHCVASLIMALSTHPLVMTIETEGPILTNDFESQWITQSKKRGSRPLRDIGITGRNQIISIIDSGLDINHKYFGPTDDKVFNEWDYSQRKVVRYDGSIGDNTEPRGGHGTKVAGAAVARARHNEHDEANGIAEDAKIFCSCILPFLGGYRMPSAFTIFNSMHSTTDRPARIGNGSWNTRYRAYPFSCRFFDEALHGQYSGDIYVASAGNEGLDDSSMQSRQRTIGNPASCKNTLAVGASQSHGDRISQGLHGIDYLAAFSSRGPTYDGRMKPDVVAPGASVLTAYAHENGRTVQAYGTSFAGPSVAGNAALIRQYFEEGHLPCDSANCSIDPSGSLVKAVLMNSAQPLKQVQVSRPWLNKNLLEEVSEYDNQHGMGLIQINKSLPILGNNKIRAIVRNDREIQDGQYHDIYIRAHPIRCVGKSYDRDFSATLAWYDPAGTSSCAKCLINDLDIKVQGINAKGRVIAGTDVFPNGTSHKDYDNNVERVRFKMFMRRRYRIRVHASNLVTASTKFSLIATGCFKVISNPQDSA